jgi:hypothetical protein
MTEHILDRAIYDLDQPTLDFLTTHALLKATAKDYIRETQKRLIVKPLCDRLLHQFQSQAAIVQHLQQHFTHLRQVNHPGYSAGNLINLLCHLQTDLTGTDFSGLMIRQADLRDTALQCTNFSQSTCIQSIFAEALSGAQTVADDGSAKLWSLETKDCLHSFAAVSISGITPQNSWCANFERSSHRVDVSLASAKKLVSQWQA